MAVVTEEGAHILDDDELEEVKELINLWKAREREILGDLAPGASTEEAPATGEEEPTLGEE